MERLTERHHDTVGYIGRYARGIPGMAETAETMRVAATRDVLQRLADYEDTGLDPAQIKRPIADLPREQCPHCMPSLHDKTRHLHVIETEAGWQILHTKNVLYCCACGRKL